MQLPTLPLPFFSIRGIGTFALVSILGSGLSCVLSTGNDLGETNSDANNWGEPCVAGSNNEINSADQCVCKIGFTWCNPNDMADLNCCSQDNSTGTGTGTDTGTSTETSTMTGTDGTADTSDSGEPSLHPEGPCTPEEEGASWCSHNEAMGPEGSRYYICTGGIWVDETPILDGDCKSANYDFAYGCVATATENSVICGVGPGTPCQSADIDYCVEDKTPPTTLAYCKDGRLTYQDCAPEPGQPCTVDGVDFEFGKCGEQAGQISCLCYDEEVGTGDSSGESGSDSSTGTGETGTGTTDTGTAGDSTTAF